MQVSLYTFIPPLGSSMMAPALPDIGINYGVAGILLDIQDIDLFMTRCHRLDDHLIVAIDILAVICHWPAFHGSAIRNVWAYMGVCFKAIYNYGTGSQ